VRSTACGATSPRLFSEFKSQAFEFLLMYGPNTNYMCVTFMLERQAEYIARAMRRLMRERATAIDVRRSVMDAYNDLVVNSLAKKTLEDNCHNYYHSASGRNVVTWPWRGTFYALARGCAASRSSRATRPPNAGRNTSSSSVRLHCPASRPR